MFESTKTAWDMTKSQERQKAIEAYNNIALGKIKGVKIHTVKIIKMGSIKFIIE